jgi:phenylacetate-CoA ligase
MSAVASIAGFMKKHVLGQSLIRRNPFYYDRASELLASGPGLDLAARREWSREQVRKTLELARATDYGRSLRAGDELSEWPLLEKENLRHGLKAFTTGREWLSAPATTGGTSGVPLRVLRSLEAIVFEQAAIDNVIQGLGVDARTVRTAVLRGDNPKDIVVSPNPESDIIAGGRILTMSANAVTHTSAEHIANTLQEFAPDLLCAYPSALETLSRYLRDHDRRLKIPCILTSSEVVRRDAWLLNEEMLGGKLADYYGQAERVAYAFAYAPREYRFQYRYSRVELIPYDGPALGRDSEYRILEVVGTTFWNSLLPIVRYRTGDLIRVPASWGEAELEEVTLGVRSFAGVLGRQQELLLCPNAVRVTGIGMMPRDVNNVLRLQIVQEDFDSARIFVLPTSSFSKEDAEVLLANARARIPPEVNVTVEIATRLEHTPRGKTPLVVHRPPVHDALRRNGIEPLFTR